MAKLIILGNGFDLHCGLKTSYFDFFEYLLKNPKYKKSYNYIFENEKFFINQERVNIWWALFLAYYDSADKFAWKDIEGIMSGFLYKPTDEFSINLKEFLDKIVNYYSKLNQLSRQEVNTYEPFFKFLWVMMIGNNLSDFGDIVQMGSGYIDFKLRDINSLYDLLKSDLTEIENHFAEYITSITKGTKAHLIANDTYCDLLGLKYKNKSSANDRAKWLGENLGEVNVISFNYTRLGQPYGGYFSAFKNIHGSIEEYHNEVIFGIDSYNITPDDPSFKFTKTYRVSILENLLEKNGKFYDGNVSLKDINEIIIYGHSLNEQDFSYFAAIFSKCNINESDTILKFFYSDYDEIDRAPYHILNLQKLVKRYEIEFNKPVGLYHRMLIEGRIHVIKI